MSVYGDAAAVTPEINHTLMVAGDLGESLVQAAAGYESVADMLIAELTAMGLNTSTTAMVGWQGPGGIIMEMTAAEFMAVCAAASAWIRVGQIQAAEVAAAHTAAVETMIPAAVCLTNRSTQAGLVPPTGSGRTRRRSSVSRRILRALLGHQRHRAHRLWAGGVHRTGGHCCAATLGADGIRSGGRGGGRGPGCGANR